MNPNELRRYGNGKSNCICIIFGNLFTNFTTEIDVISLYFYYCLMPIYPLCGLVKPAMIYSWPIMIV